MKTSMLFASLAALVVGPLLFQYFRYRPHWYRLLDGFVVVMISGIVVLEVVPEILASQPVWGIALLIVGLMGPTYLEHQFHRFARQVHWVALYLAMLGLLIHAFIDGVVLSEITGSVFSSDSLLGVGVVLHRIPVGLTIWMLFLPRLGRWKASLILVLLGVGTVGGFTFEMFMGVWQEREALILFQALAAGSILHVVIHRPHEYHQTKMQEESSRLLRYGEGIGNVVGLVVLFLIAMLTGIVEPSNVEAGHAHHHSHGFGEMGHILLGMAIESAPALLLAYLAGGLVYTLLPATSIRWMKKGPPLVRSVKGVTVGLPLPICTCGVLPLYQSLIKRGAPPTAAMAFLIATPELGLDAILISIPLLGGDMTVVRLVAAGFIALFVGWVVGTFVERSGATNGISHQAEAETQAIPLADRIKKGLRHGFGPLVDDTAPWIIVGLLIAALANPLLQSGWLQGLPGGTEVAFFALLGLPIYVCASGATPIVAVLLINSVSPGAALAFLLTGPATNVSTFGILSRVHNRKTAILFGVLTTAVAVLLGYLVNMGLPYIDVLSASDFEGEEVDVWQVIALIALIIVFLMSLVRRGARGFAGEVTSGFRGTHSHAHEEGMNGTCTHSQCEYCEPEEIPVENNP